MKALLSRFLEEPAFALGVLNAALQVIAAVALPGWGHVAVAVAGAMLAAVSTRQLVTPASALRDLR